SVHHKITIQSIFVHKRTYTSARRYHATNRNGTPARSVEIGRARCVQPQQRHAHTGGRVRARMVLIYFVRLWPAQRRKRATVSVNPSSRASWSGVLPLLSGVFGSAPRVINIRTIVRSAYSQCKSVFPSLSRAFTFVP